MHAFWFRTFAGLLASSIVASADEPPLTLASSGRAAAGIFISTGASAPERHAARELADHLQQITSAPFAVTETDGPLPASAILVGPGTNAARLFPGVPWDELGPEEFVIRTSGQRLLLAGGRPRGTLYAAYRFLHEPCGVRWWTPWATHVPRRDPLAIPPLNLRAQPAFEARDPFWFAAFDRDWAVRNLSNSQHSRIDEDRGGRIVYRGFVHTFFPLVPPDPHFASHPEWYSLIQGKRTAQRAQLCLSNPSLRDFVASQVRQWLRETPDARIVSISQNDWHGQCQCDACQAIDKAEGTPAGSLLDFINDIAARIEPDHPDVAIDTLAYQYTRKAPLNLRPRPNVIIRLCSIECNFAEALDAPSNADFARDIRDWSRICRRLYVWDYTTDFAHYLQPHPNWFVLGPNVRFFHEHHVRGLFEQGAYQSHGAEMAELRAWVLAQLMWNPYQDDQKLIQEFLEGYYGKPAAPFIRQYLELMSERARGFKLTCFSPSRAPFLNGPALAAAETLWNQAEQAAAPNPDHLWRVRIARLPLRYVWLSQWDRLRQELDSAAQPWPLLPSRSAVARDFLQLAAGPGPQGWMPITHLNESGLTPQQFVSRLPQDPR